MSTITLDQLPEWLEKFSGDEIQLVRKRGDQLAQRASDALRRIIDIAKEIADSSVNPSLDRVEIEVAAKFGQRVISLGEKIGKPEPPTYENLRLFLDGLNAFYRDLMRAGAVWIRKLDRGYKEPVRRMQLQLNDLRNSARLLDDHLQQKYVEVRKFESLIKEVESAKSTSSEIELAKEEVRLGKAAADRNKSELNALESKKVSLETSERMKEAKKLESDVEVLRNGIKRILDPLEKPFDKFLRLSDKSRGGLAPGVLDAISEYLHDPIVALTKDEASVSRLCSAMQSLQVCLESDTLGLKDARVRAALRAISAIMEEDTLKSLRSAYLETSARLDAFLQSVEMTTISAEKAQVDAKVESLNAELARIARSTQESAARLEELIKRLDDQKEKIEKNIKGLTGQTVRLSS